MTMDDAGVLTARDKGLPGRAAGLTVTEFLATAPRLEEFWTPLIVLDDAAMTANVATMAQWCAERGLALMPHGKTTMAPALWKRQRDAGALGITFATMGQVRTARDLGADSVMLANAAVDRPALAWLAQELADPGFRFVSWADSVATVETMEAALLSTAIPRPVDVCVELGGEGGRTGARSIAEAVRVAERIAASSVLRLAGVAGYEGSLAHDRSPAALAAVRAYLQSQLELHSAITPLYDAGELFVTAGGSAYFDVVADVWGATARDDRTHFTLRSGAYIVHDDGFYRGISPFDEGAVQAEDSPRFLNAMHAIARVVSAPEPGLALVDAGKRDLPYDEGLPIPRSWSRGVAGPWQPLHGEVSAMNDQHSYVRSEQSLAIGSVVRLGLSHPCTAFDKWRVLPVVESAGSDVVTGLVRTYF
ncbi:MAG: alanine racemase [Microbacterium sp.]|uniref:alanine racemase n=2 Tax=Microbacterium sp. TaxID=51671 RepID=UPI0026279C2E|nr:alanine racemase [Microbacterium sp.]MCV0335989.1 alanine racemase [Microbacterium sp.]MCV0377182.1 alanine racemase [Microbacterium sp.]MCV0390837.1 alanine racemase [Microbacterium sp.]MCV0419612.1 alanine racemase [Microbacterium sp.]MCV0422677.1 alanine racemase [Microbacterium sp.]